MVLDDFLFAENSTSQSNINSPALTSGKASAMTSPRIDHSNSTTPDGRSEIYSSGGSRYNFIVIVIICKLLFFALT